MFKRFCHPTNCSSLAALASCLFMYEERCSLQTWGICWRAVLKASLIRPTHSAAVPFEESYPSDANDTSVNCIDYMVSNISSKNIAVVIDCSTIIIDPICFPHRLNFGDENLLRISTVHCRAWTSTGFFLSIWHQSEHFIH